MSLTQSFGLETSPAEVRSSPFRAFEHQVMTGTTDASSTSSLFISDSTVAAGKTSGLVYKRCFPGSPWLHISSAHLWRWTTLFEMSSKTAVESAENINWLLGILTCQTSDSFCPFGTGMKSTKRCPSCFCSSLLFARCYTLMTDVHQQIQTPSPTWYTQ